MGSFWLAARVLLYASSHRQDNTYHSFVTPVVEHWLWNKKLLNGSTMKDWSDDPSHHERTLLPRSYMCTYTSTIDYGRLSQCFCWALCSQSTHASNVKNIVMVKISQGKVTCAHCSCLTMTVTLENDLLYINGRHHFTYSQECPRWSFKRVFQQVKSWKMLILLC